jgi:hypothetical protein
MGGAMLQLALYGSQDVLLTGNPQVTFFRVQYKRYSLYASEAISQTFQGVADMGRKCVCPITKQGDLVTSAWLQVTLPDLKLFQYGTPQEATSTVPGILSARFASSTTAVIKVIPPTDGLSDRYIVTVTRDDAVETEFEGASGSTSITVTGLSTARTYSVVARRVRSNNTEGSNSASMDVITLRWCNNVGHALIRSVELSIGGSLIDRHVGEYLDIMSELTLPEEKRAGFETMIGKYPSYDLYDNSFDGPKTLYIPLQFAFNRSPGLAIPLISLAFHDVVLNFDFRDYTELIKSNVAISSLTNERGALPAADISLWSTFIFLDVEERRRYSTQPHEQLIEQVQFLGDAPIIIDADEPTSTRKINLNFSHPIKEIVWVYNPAKSYNLGLSPSQYASQGNDYFNYGLISPYASEDPISTAYIQINGHQRFSTRPGSYFRLCVPYMHHTRIPTKNVYSYSFSLQPEDLHQPSGSLNYSRVDTSQLITTLNSNMTTSAYNGRIRVFATNFQVLRIASGMAGLAFAAS